MITVQNLSRIFHVGDAEIRALNQVDVHINTGEFISVTGRSGSGKSTLLYQMSALDRPTSGTVLIEGTDITVLTSRERTAFRLNTLGFVFQDYALLPELTALENVMVPLLMQGYSFAEARQKSTAAIAQVDLLDRIDNRPTQLSGGQQQRVSIARAIAHEPKILFADEPTANLDSETSKHVLDIFLSLNKKGQTIIMVTHEKDYAALATRTLELSDGEIVSDRRK